MPDQNLNPFLLAANVPEPDARLLPLLRSNPDLASRQDSHGYSLLHAAASYNHVELLRSLVKDFHVNVNLKDEDGETCLFVTETVDAAKCLVEELQIDTTLQNDDGMTAMEKIASDEEFPEIATYLQECDEGGRAIVNGTPSTLPNADMGHPPPLPPNMNISINAATEDQLGGLSEQDPDPEFRRRIEELASRENFNTEEGQRELRALITDAMRGVGHEERDVRRRVD